RTSMSPTTPARTTTPMGGGGIEPKGAPPASGSIARTRRISPQRMTGARAEGEHALDQNARHRADGEVGAQPAGYDPGGVSADREELHFPAGRVPRHTGGGTGHPCAGPRVGLGPCEQRTGRYANEEQRGTRRVEDLHATLHDRE